MTSILLAVANEGLAAALRSHLHAAGHAVLALDRPLALLTQASPVLWDAIIVDDSRLGDDALTVLSGVAPGCRIIGAGTDDPRAHHRLPLPLDMKALAAALATTSKSAGGPTPILRPERRVAVADGREVELTRTEYRLLEILLKEYPRIVTTSQVEHAVWGSEGSSGTSAPLRGHVRNLRLKLSQIGLPQSIRSVRGKGYSFVL